MNINRYTQRITVSASTGLLFLTILMVVPLKAMAEPHNKNLSQNAMTSQVDTLVKDVLKNTEQSLSMVESNTWDSLQHVENAIASILEIKSQLSADTHVESKSPLIVEGSKEYWFKYPQVSEEILSNKDKFPNLHSKFKSGVLYRGDDANQSQDEIVGYFDYAFAYASLKMAREALTVKNYREATSTLKWVFEAVYLNPDFYVVAHNDKLMIDKLLNIQGEFPLISNATR